MMEFVRVLLLDHSINPSSWYRCPMLNEAVGGSENSAHTRSLAVDFKPPQPWTLENAFDAIAESDFPFDQLIKERANNGAEWIHMGLSYKQPRRELLGASGDMRDMTFQRILED